MPTGGEPRIPVAGLHTHNALPLLRIPFYGLPVRFRLWIGWTLYAGYAVVRTGLMTPTLCRLVLPGHCDALPLPNTTVVPHTCYYGGVNLTFGLPHLTPTCTHYRYPISRYGSCYLRFPTFPTRCLRFQPHLFSPHSRPNTDSRLPATFYTHASLHHHTYNTYTTTVLWVGFFIPAVLPGPATTLNFYGYASYLRQPALLVVLFQLLPTVRTRLDDSHTYLPRYLFPVHCLGLPRVHYRLLLRKHITFPVTPALYPRTPLPFALPRAPTPALPLPTLPLPHCLRCYYVVPLRVYIALVPALFCYDLPFGHGWTDLPGYHGDSPLHLVLRFVYSWTFPWDVILHRLATG